MRKQLGITKLRSGPSGDPNNPNAAKTDEAKFNMFTSLPDLITTKDGTRATSADQWWKQRRPEIVADFERDVLGRIPDDVPRDKCELLKTIEKKLGETDVIEERLVGRVDDSTCPELPVNIIMKVIVPKGAAKPVPVLMQLGFAMWGFHGSI